VSATVGVTHRRGDAQLEAVHVGAQFGDDLNTVVPTPNGQRGLLPGFTTWNAAAGWTVGTSPAVTIFVAVKNLLDSTPIVDRRRGVMVGLPRLVHVGTRVRF
jgi:Fe(3+) dicitrate transport protein